MESISCQSRYKCLSTNHNFRRSLLTDLAVPPQKWTQSLHKYDKAYVFLQQIDTETYAVGYRNVEVPVADQFTYIVKIGYQSIDGLVVWGKKVLNKDIGITNANDTLDKRQADYLEANSWTQPYRGLLNTELGWRLVRPVIIGMLVVALEDVSLDRQGDSWYDYLTKAYYDEHTVGHEKPHNVIACILPVKMYTYANGVSYYVRKDSQDPHSTMSAAAEITLGVLMNNKKHWPPAV